MGGMCNGDIGTTRGRRCAARRISRQIGVGDHGDDTLLVSRRIGGGG
jgi:hypothetical protein